MLRVRLLGSFAVYIDGEEALLPTSKSRELAAYLFLNHGSAIRRDFMSELLWPGKSEERASAYLRQALYYIRRSVRESGIDVIETGSRSLRAPLHPAIHVDALAFVQEAQRGLGTGSNSIEILASADSMYAGDLLDGLDDDWCVGERQRLSDLHVQVLDAVVKRLAASGLHLTALPYAKKWVAKDPLNEEAHRALIRLYANSGQVARAIRQFENCRRMLHDELGVEPGNETTALCSRLGLPAAELAREVRLALPNSARPASRSSRRRLSADSRSNASFLVVYGEDAALKGNLAEGVAALEDALSAYQLLDDVDGRARVYLAMGTALLYTPFDPQPREALAALQKALDHYRSGGAEADLRRALVLSAEAAYASGMVEQAAAYSEEGLALTTGPADNCATASFATVLSIARLDGNRMREANETLERYANALACLTDINDVLNLAFYRGVTALMSGDVRASERLLKEAIHLASALADSPRVRHMMFYMKHQLMFVQYIRGKHREVLPFDVPDESPSLLLQERALEMLSWKSQKRDHETAVRGFERWFRTAIGSVPPYYVYGVVRHLVAEMLSIGDARRGGQWAAVGIKITRAIGFREHEALFRSLKAVCLAKQWRIESAERLCEWATARMDPGEAWTPAHLLWAQGLIASARGEREAALQSLHQAEAAFQIIGCRFIERQVRADVVQISRETLSE